MTILKISDFCQKFDFGYFGRSLVTRGFRKFQFFWFSLDFVFFDFFGFLGGRQILAGGYGAVLVCVSRM